MQPPAWLVQFMEQQLEIRLFFSKNTSRSLFMFVYRCFGCQICNMNKEYSPCQARVGHLCCGRQVLVPALRFCDRITANSGGRAVLAFL